MQEQNEICCACQLFSCMHAMLTLGDIVGRPGQIQLYLTPLAEPIDLFGVRHVSLLVLTCAYQRASEDGPASSSEEEQWCQR